MMLEKHFPNKFSAIKTLHKTMNICPFDLKLVQVGFFFLFFQVRSDECERSKYNT